jgi:8-oxo-dGTP pyrophosphatase MutT (NUDIX family)
MDAQQRRFSAGDFRLRARAQAEITSEDDYGDHRMNPDLRELWVHDRLHDAAVLVPIVDRGDEATMILTKRTDTLRSHSGQVAFPGGRIDPTDASPEDAALREATEEIGLDPSMAEVVGRLPDYVAGSGYRIVPVLAIIQPQFKPEPNPHEVASVFEVPLRFVMDPANHVRDSRIWLEKERFFYRMPYEDWMIWGVTAGIIHGLYERLYA